MMRIITSLLLMFAACVPIDPNGNQSARQFCLELASMPDDNPQDQASRSIFVDLFIAEIEIWPEFGLSRSESSQAIFIECEDSENDFCVTCGLAVVAEVYDNYTPTPGALGVCRRSRYEDDTIESLRSLLQIEKDEGFTKSDFIVELSDSDVCNTQCSNEGVNFDEFFTFSDCLAGCTSCFIALADEVWN